MVIVGGGFGGLNAARALADAPVDVVLVDRSNHHLFQPLLYQVATAALSPADIASPIRKVLKKQANAAVVLAEAREVDPEREVVRTDLGDIGFDVLVLAAGATHSYFSNDHWAPYAPGLKTIDDATEIRRRFLLAFEAAELEQDPEARLAALTFVVVGAGPTGVELAGALSEIAHEAIPHDFKMIDTTTARVVLVELKDRVLPAMDERCSKDAHRALEELGVEVMVGTEVTAIDEGGVTMGGDRIDADNVFWAAGVQASPLGRSLGVELDRAGRVKVEPDLSIPGHDRIFVIGDQAHAVDPETGAMVPGLAQGAIQGGRYVAGIIADEAEAAAAGRPAPEREPFRYRDKGTLATIGRNKAVADIRGLKLRGFVAWFLWVVVHVMFLVSFRNRMAVMSGWIWSYLFYDRGARLITGNRKVKVRRSLFVPPDGS
ncbi:MAG TPA: NAD(P)/FAD-dependent oxidoreductase [Methylomirabilota bacterium]|nr:NAD(P)/FAD-dependent oxidoreductase [Methylomirabilota bacterium]